MGLSSYTIDYGKLKGNAKAKKAAEDIKFYLGEDRFEKLTKDFAAAKLKNFYQFVNWAGLAGIRGYPAEVWWDICYPDRAGQHDIPEEDVK